MMFYCGRRQISFDADIDLVMVLPVSREIFKFFLFKLQTRLFTINYMTCSDFCIWKHAVSACWMGQTMYNCRVRFRASIKRKFNFIKF